jgi:copper(I)-binding protein
VSRAEHSTPTRRRVLSGIVPSVLGIGLAAVLVGCGAGQITQTASQVSAVNGASGMAGPIAIRNVQLAYPNNKQGTFAPGSDARVIMAIVNTGLADDTLVRITTPAATSVTIDGSATGSKLIPGGFSVASGVDDDDSTAAPTVPATDTPPFTGSVPAQVTGSASPSSAPGSASVPPSSGSVSPSGSVAPSSGSVAPSSPVVTTTASAPQAPGRVVIELIGMRSVNGAPLRAGLTIPMTFYFAHAGQVTLAQVPIGAPPDTSS